MDGIAGIQGWQWLFLTEGVPAFLLAFASLKLLPNGPAEASWLDPHEKQIITARLAAEEPSGPSDIWSALRDPRLIALSVANLVYQSCFYGVALWLPQIVQAMGFSNFVTGFVVAAPFLLGAVGMAFGGRSSSKRNERIWHVVAPLACRCRKFWRCELCAILLSDPRSDRCWIDRHLYRLRGLFSLPSTFLRGAAMILVGRSSDRRNKPIWHTAIPWLISAAGFAAASTGLNNILGIGALVVAMAGLITVFGPYYSLSSSFQRGPEGAAGIALVNVMSVGIGGFLGPNVVGMLKEQTRGYAAGLLALAAAQVISAVIVLTLGRVTASRSQLAQVRAGAAP